MEIMYSKNSNELINKNRITGIYKDKQDLKRMGITFEGISYDDEWTVSHFLNNSNEKNEIVIKMFNDLDIETSILNKKIKTISNGYLKIVLLVYALLYIKDTIYLDYFDKGLSCKKKKKIVNYLKSNCKNIVVISNDLIFLSSLCYHLIVFKNGKIVYNNDTKKMFNSNIKIDYPEIYNFIKLANKNGAKLKYTYDTKELLKDIYRSVR